MGEESRGAAAALTGRIIRAGDAQRLLASRSETSADSRLTDLHREARAHGFREGVGAATKDLVAALASLRRYTSDPERWIGQTVFAVLEKLLGDRESSELVPLIAAEAIAGCRNEFESVDLHVHPRVADAVAARLSGIVGAALTVDVVADPALNETACELHTPFGLIDASLDTQLAALADAFKADSKACDRD